MFVRLLTTSNRIWRTVIFFDFRPASISQKLQTISQTKSKGFSLMFILQKISTNCN